MDADVIVIGAGPGGLSCAAYLSALGRKVIVVDRHTVPGGNMSCFTHRDPASGQEYEFDVGLHYLGDCGPGGSLRSVLDPLGVRPEYLPMDPEATTPCCSATGRCPSSGCLPGFRPTGRR